MTNQTNSPTEQSRNVPTLRFPEFKGDWEKKKLGEVAEISSGGTPSRTNPYYWNGKIPWVSTTLIDFNFIKKADEYITEEGLKNSSAKLFPKGTLLMAMYGQGKTRGKIAILNIEATTNQACGAITTNNEILSPLFAFQNIAKRYDEIRDLSNQGGQENLSGGIIKGIEISFPTLPEQSKIASFLTAVDAKIQALKKKKSLLQQYKKGVMQRLFANRRDDACIVFTDDNGKAFPKWERKKLGEVCDFFRGSPISKSDLDINGKYSCIHYGELFTKYNEVITNIISKTNKENGFLSQIGDILMPSSDVTPKGLAKASSIQIENVILGGDMNILRPNKNYCSKYLSYLLNFNTNKIIEIVSGTTVKHIYNKDVRNLEFVISNSFEEQTKIANFLSSIDEKINQTQTQIQQTEIWKKGLLQQMFV